MKSLNKLFYLKREIENLRAEIHQLSEINGMRMTGLPKAQSDDDAVSGYCLKKDRLVDKLNKKIERYINEWDRIESVIDEIDDIEIQSMARMRFIQNLKWEEIGEIVGYDRTVCSRKVRKYIQEHQLDLDENLHTKSH